MPKEATEQKQAPANKTDQAITPPVSKRGKWKILLILFIIIGVLAAGAAGAIRYKLVDLTVLNEKYEISKYPYIGKYIDRFLQAVQEQENVEVEPAQPVEQKTSDSTEQTELVPKASRVLPEQPPSKPVIVDDSELKQQVLIKQQEEQKRLLKVSRLYDGMKPEAAAPILSELEDETVILIFSKMDQEKVSKILTLLDPKHSARLSNLMLKGQVHQ